MEDIMNGEGPMRLGYAEAPGARPGRIDWPVVCGVLVGAARHGHRPGSLIELERLTGVPRARLRDVEKAAERAGFGFEEGRWTR